MPTASILTKTSDQKVSTDGTGEANIDVTWDVETKFLDADVDFFDSGVDDTLLAIPSSLDGEVYEVFIWCEDDTNDWGDTGNGTYIGMQANGLGWSQRYWGIQRDVGRASRGARSGPILADSDGASWFSRVREFQSTLMEFGDKCRFGVLTGDAVPRAIGIAKEAAWSTTNSTEADMDLDEEYDYNNCYNPATGVYTAPPGATLAIPCVNGRIDSGTDTARVIYRLDIEGVERANFQHGGSTRGFTPGTFGLIDVTAGDELKFTIQDNGGIRSGTFGHSVEFY